MDGTAVLLGGEIKTESESGAGTPRSMIFMENPRSSGNSDKIEWRSSSGGEEMWTVRE
jgi:hypothetical protein